MHLSHSFFASARVNIMQRPGDLELSQQNRAHVNQAADKCLGSKVVLRVHFLLVQTL